MRAYRRAQGITQAYLAGLCGVSTRFISDLENEKSTIALGKVLQVMQGLGMELYPKAIGVLPMDRFDATARYSKRV